MARNIITIRGVTKTYQNGAQRIEALKNIDLTVQEGDSVCIIGPSGSGKSTLLQIIGGLDTASGGEVDIDGQNMMRMNDRELSLFRNQTVGFVFQFFNLMDYLNAEQNVALPLVIGGKDSTQTTEEARRLMEKVNLGHRLKQYPNQLSGGEMQRAAIARALTGQPKIILADEPTGNLDKENAHVVMQTLSDLAKDGVTVVMVTHDPRAIEYFQTIVEMEDGKIKKLTTKKQK